MRDEKIERISAPVPIEWHSMAVDGNCDIYSKGKRILDLTT